MKPYTMIARIPLNYDDAGRYALSDQGRETLDNLISKRLPDDASWCGDEIIAPIDFDSSDFDITSIIDDAWEELLCMDDDENWEA